MKYTVAWANALSQNSILKATVGVLLVSTFIFCLTTVKLAVKGPFIIERECYSRTLTTADSKHSQTEMEQFIKVALPKRFDSDGADFRSVLSEDEIQFRAKEQEDLSKKGVSQRVNITSVKMEGSSATVEADRVLSAGKIRSALFFPLKVTLATTSRTPSNPYGLILKRVSQVQVEDGK